MNRHISYFLRMLALALFVVYCLWNFFWLVQVKVPPALFLGLTGLPAPTTGGTRAILALTGGQWRESLRLNPMAVPITLLLLWSLAWLAWGWVARRRLELPERFLWVWGFFLLAAWGAKLVLYFMSS